MREIWKPVVGYEGKYEVSNLGRVRSLNRVIMQKSKWGTVYPYHKKGKILRPGNTSAGYPSVVLRNHTPCSLVHRLVAEAFIGTCPPGLEVRHKNGKRNDPRLVNLQYGTRKENIEDSKRHGTFQLKYLALRKISPSQIRKAVALGGRGMTQKAIAEKIGVSVHLVGKAIRGEYASLY